MSPHATEEQLNDLADGLLAEAERIRVERHLGGCPECRDRVRRLRELRAHSEALPRSIPPPRDLWPEIAQRIQAKAIPIRDLAGAGPGGIASRSLWSLRYPLAAAAVVLIVLSSTLTALFVRGPGRAPVTTAPIPVATGPGAVTPATAPALAQVRELEAAYRRAADELSATLRENRSSLPPEALVVVERNLRVIDEAIRESEAALADDPANPALARMLLATHRQRLDLLQRTARLSAET